MMKNNKEKIELPMERIINRIFLIRGKKVMFDRDLAQLYGVPTGRLNEAVRRNKERFPEDFMFQLNEKETKVWQEQILRSQIVTSDNRPRSQIAILKKGKNIKYAPYVFTEQGVAMLSSVLNSKQAIAVNIQIIRIFTKLREILSNNKKLAEKVENIEKQHNADI